MASRPVDTIVACAGCRVQLDVHVHSNAYKVEFEISTKFSRPLGHKRWVSRGTIVEQNRPYGIVFQIESALPPSIKDQVVDFGVVEFSVSGRQIGTITLPRIEATQPTGDHDTKYLMLYVVIEPDRIVRYEFEQ